MSVDPLPAASPGIDPGRVAEILVTLPDGGARRGSGYRIGPATVLTAAHVPEAAESVRVRFAADRPGEWTAEVSSQWLTAGSDLAVLTIAAGSTGPAVEPAPFAGLPYDDAVIELRSVGFPLWKLRNDVAGNSTYRDSHHAVGKGALLSNSREGTLEFTVTPPADGTPGGASPWEGMSGAAVWYGEAIVGVVSEHHRSDGLGRLAVARLDRGLEQLSSAEHWKLGKVVPSLGPDNHLYPSGGGEWREEIRTAYHEILQDLAPEALFDRGEELTELVRFCAGDEPYLWWQAGPWAGKSALMASFARFPPGGVDTVSFFITSRLSGEADSEAFLSAMIEQLRALAGQSGEVLATAGGRRGQFLDLLRVAGERSQRAGRRLVVVVDGLDEDVGLDPAAGRRSIVSLLPRQPPQGVRIVVASRPHPSLLENLRADHPLARIEPRQLTASPHAEDIEVEARRELWHLLAGSWLQRELIGLITASGGGLTLSDLEQLTGQPAFELEMMICGVSGRSLQDRYGSADIHPDRARVYLFAHETLRALAEQQLGAGLASYRDRIHRWAETFREAGWPVYTPGFVFRGYPRLLGALGDLPRLTACALDSTRHDRMQNITGGDYLALSEVIAAQELNLAGDPDLGCAVRLSVVWNDLTRRSSTLPLNLPAVWAAVGEPTRAETLARGLIGPDRQATALLRVAERMTDSFLSVDRLLTLVWSLCDDISIRYDRLAAQEGVVRAVAARGDCRRAESLARTITDEEYREHMLCAVAFALAEGGQRQAAEELANSFRELRLRAYALAAAGASAADAGDQGEAHRIWLAATEAASSAEPPANADALQVVTEMIAASGDLDRALVVAGRILEPAQRVEALSAIAACGQDDATTSRLLAEAEAIAQSMTDASGRFRSLRKIAIAAAAIDDDERARRLITDLDARHIDTELAETLAGVGRLWHSSDAARCSLVRRPAERLAVQVTEDMAMGFSWPGHEKPLVLAAQALVAIGDYDLATDFVTAIPDLERRIQALTDLAESMLDAGAADRARTLVSQAELLASTPSEVRHSNPVAVRIVDGFVAIGDWDRAELLASDIYGSVYKARAWQSIATQAAATGEFDRAEAAMSRLPAGWERVSAIGEVAEAMARAGQPARALDLLLPAGEAVVGRPADSSGEMMVIAVALATAGQPDRAAALARGIVDPEIRVRALTEIVRQLGAGHHDAKRDLLAEAESVARQLPADRMAGQLALVAAAIGDQDRARALLSEAEEQVRRDPIAEYHRVTEMGWLAESMVAAGEAERARSLIADAELAASALTGGYPGEGLLAFSAAVVGDFDRAEKLAEGTVGQDRRAWALAELAKQLATARYYARADDVAGRVAGSGGPAETFAALADIILGGGPGVELAVEQRRWARRFAARALASGPWYLTAKAVALLDRRAFYWAIDR